MIVKDESDGVGFGGGGRWSRGLGRLIRRKQVDSVHFRRHAQLARKLSAVDLVGIGVGATIGAGVYILIGTVAREQAGPSLVLSLLFAGIAARLSAFCYAELACSCPSAGSAYHYTYICIGEGVAWLAGWSLILEYTIGASAVARGITPNLQQHQKEEKLNLEDQTTTGNREKRLRRSVAVRFQAPISKSFMGTFSTSLLLLFFSFFSSSLSIPNNPPTLKGVDIENSILEVSPSGHSASQDVKNTLRCEPSSFGYLQAQNQELLLFDSGEVS